MLKVLPQVCKACVSQSHFLVSTPKKIQMHAKVLYSCLVASRCITAILPSLASTRITATTLDVSINSFGPQNLPFGEGIQVYVAGCCACFTACGPGCRTWAPNQEHPEDPTIGLVQLVAQLRDYPWGVVVRVDAMLLIRFVQLSCPSVVRNLPFPTWVLKIYGLLQGFPRGVHINMPNTPAYIPDSMGDCNSTLTSTLAAWPIKNRQQLPPAP